MADKEKESKQQVCIKNIQPDRPKFRTSKHPQNKFCLHPGKYAKQQKIKPSRPGQKHYPFQTANAATNAPKTDSRTEKSVFALPTRTFKPSPLKKRRFPGKQRGRERLQINGLTIIKGVGVGPTLMHSAPGKPKGFRQATDKKKENPPYFSVRRIFPFLRFLL